MDKNFLRSLLVIENKEIEVLREILSNLCLEEQTLLQEKPVHRTKLIEERIALRKKARALRIRKQTVLGKFLVKYELDVEVELQILENQRQIIVEKTLLQLKHNRQVKVWVRQQSLLSKNYQEEKPKAEKKTLLLPEEQNNIGI